MPRSGPDVMTPPAATPTGAAQSTVISAGWPLVAVKRGFVTAARLRHQPRSEISTASGEYEYFRSPMTRTRPSMNFRPNVTLMLACLSSPRSEIAAWVFSPTPSYSWFRTKFTTPATASAPHAADAPPVTISTRLMRLVGMVRVSIAPPGDEGTTRRLSSSVRVREDPSARRLTVSVPPPETPAPGARDPAVGPKD